MIPYIVVYVLGVLSAAIVFVYRDKIVAEAKAEESVLKSDFAALEARLLAVFHKPAVASAPIQAVPPAATAPVA